MRWSMAATIAAAAGALASCATMEPAQCAVADWQAIGVQDGEAGRGLDHFEARSRDCAKAGYSADFPLYSTGREQGLLRYCTPERGFREGLNGASYKGVCPSHLAGGFLVAFNEGDRAHDALEGVRSAESEISSLESRLDENAKKLRMNEDGLAKPNVPDAERQRLRAEVDKYRDERRDLRRQLSDAEDKLRYRRLDLDRARMEIGYRWGAW